MTIGPKLQQEVTVIQEQSKFQRLRRIWDKQLDEAQTQFPGAPSELLKKGLVTTENYTKANLAIGKFSSNYMAKACYRAAIRFKKLPKFSRIAFGCGIGRGWDSDWVCDALKAGIKPQIFDVSQVGCRIGWATIHPIIELAKTKGIDTGGLLLTDIVKEGELESLICSQNLNWQKTSLFYFSRVIQFLDKQAFRTVMIGVGRSLSNEMDQDKKNQVVIIHPFQKDNEHVKWKRTTPYSEEEMLYYLFLGAGRDVGVKWRNTHRYFEIEDYYQLYTAFTVVAM